MTYVNCSIDDILEIISELHKANTKIVDISNNLDIVIQEKGKNWSGDSKNGFIRFYQYWRKISDEQSSVLEKAIQQLQKLSEEYQRVNTK